MIPARRTYGLLGVGMVIAAIVATVWDDRTHVVAWLITLLIWDGLILGLAIWDSRRVSRVRVERSGLSKLSIGRDNVVSLSVEAGQAAEVQIYDAYPIEFGVSQMPLAATLPSNSTQELIYTVHPTRRGEYLWGAIQVRQLSPWRLVWNDWRRVQPQNVAVYPDLIGLRSLSIRLTLQSSGSIRRARRLGIGTEFAELRDYGIGDDPRFIDWKATARRGQPLVRVLEPEQEQTLIILLDRGRLMTADVKGLSRLDLIGA